MITDFSDRKERAPYVRYEKFAVDDPQATLAAGHYVARDVDFALVTPPYTRDVFKQEAKDFLENMRIEASAGRIPQEWYENYQKGYAAWKKGEEIPLNGIPIKGWLMASPAQQQACIQANILTVEDLANANDEGVKRLGLGGLQLKNMAQSALAATKDVGKVVLENTAMKNQIAIQEGTIQSLQRQVEELINTVKQMSVIGPAAKVDYVPHETINAKDILDEPQEDSHMAVPGESDEELIALYIEKFGQKPHHRAKIETIRAAVKSA